MGLLRALLAYLITGLILWVTMIGGLWFAGLVVGFLPLGFLGGFSEIAGILLLIIIFGAVGRFGVKYIP